MKFLTKRQVQEMVLYTDQHLGRLERVGKFPKRIKIGPNRVGYLEHRVLDWMKERVERSDELDRHS